MVGTVQGDCALALTVINGYVEASCQREYQLLILAVRVAAAVSACRSIVDVKHTAHIEWQRAWHAVG
jgi:hypothetical protein